MTPDVHKATFRKVNGNFCNLNEHITSDLTNIWKDDGISISLKKICVYFLVWSFAQYDSKRKRVRNVYTQMWVWCRMLRLRCTLYIWVRYKVGEKEGLLCFIKRRKLARDDHWKRR